MPQSLLPERAVKIAPVAMKLHPDDSVAVARRAIAAGETFNVGGEVLTALDPVPAGHKIALRSAGEAEPVIKYGQVIGFARKAVAAGQHVHTHNLEMRDFGRDYQFGTDIRSVAHVAPEEMRYFQGYQRPGGRAGTRNYVAIISSVNCSASVTQHVVRRFQTEQFRRDFPNVDGVIGFTHKTGCCVQPGEPQAMFQRVLAGMARHPNIFGYIMIGLGCEGTQVDEVKTNFKLDVLKPGQPAPAFMTIQQTGGVSKSVERATAAIAALLPQANRATRTRQPISELALAMNCGGSDGNSGITANPALGLASDELVKYRGTSVLAETTEIYGAEHLLTRRAISPAVGQRLVERIRWWEQHVRLHNATIDNNPTPGNKAGGLTTIYEKSLGAIAKAGQSPLAAVYHYAEQILAEGLCFMDTPGFDPVSMTGLVSGGCNIGVFTTGRGSVYGCKPAPCIKVASNSTLYENMIDDMDLNAGTIIDGLETIEQVGQRLFEKIIAVAGGERTKSEVQNLGDEEFAPWILGPTF